MSTHRDTRKPTSTLPENLSKNEFAKEYYKNLDDPNFYDGVLDMAQKQRENPEEFGDNYWLRNTYGIEPDESIYDEPPAYEKDKKKE